MREKRRAPALLAAALLLALALTACGGEEGGGITSQGERAYTSTLLAMDTVMDFTVYGDGAQEAVEAAQTEIQRLEGLLSVTREDSEVWALNHAGGVPTVVSRDTGELLELAATLGERTGGALDITIYPLVRAWGFTTGSYQVPSQEEIDGLLAHVDYAAVLYDRLEGTALLPEGAEIDLGAIGKGYAGLRVARILRQEGITSALVNLGGNVQTVGNRPDGAPWRVAVTDPREGSEGYLGILEVTDMAVVTSGGYERYFEADGETYWHILDPETGRPAESGLVSVTVVGSDGAVCDGLSTAFFVMGKEEALAYWRRWGGFELILVEEGGAVTVTEGLSSAFTLQAEGYTLDVAEQEP